MKKQTFIERAALAYWMAGKYEPSYPRPTPKENHEIDQNELKIWYKNYIKTRCNGKELV